MSSTSPLCLLIPYTATESITALLPYFRTLTTRSMTVLSSTAIINHELPSEPEVLSFSEFDGQDPYYASAISVLENTHHCVKSIDTESFDYPTWLERITVATVHTLTGHDDIDLIKTLKQLPQVRTQAQKFYQDYGFDWRDGYQLTLIGAQHSARLATGVAHDFAEKCTLPTAGYDVIAYSSNPFREVNIDHRIIFLDAGADQPQYTDYIRKCEKYLRNYIDHCYSITLGEDVGKANTLYLNPAAPATLDILVFNTALQVLCDRLSADTPEWVGKGTYQNFPVFSAVKV